MNRRTLTFGAIGIPVASLLRPPAARAVVDVPRRWRGFEVTTEVTLVDAPGAAQLFLPLVQTAPGYQTVLSTRLQGNGNTAVTSDSRYGAAMLSTTWDGRSGDPKTVRVVQVVNTQDRNGADRMLSITDAERQFWTAPTESMPLDGIVRDTAARIVAGHTDARARLRALYDWVVDNTSRNPETPGCGFGDIKSMLDSGNLSGKCADINGLMTGLARAAGFPARDVYGVRVAASSQFPCLGASGTVSKAQHCRSEAYLDGVGWFPLDPADVRKVVLEQKLALGSPKIHALRESLFGGWEMNWVGYNSATDIELPGLSSGKEPNFAFLMYPCAFTSGGQPNCLDPDRFRYEISSRELTG